MSMPEVFYLDKHQQWTIVNAVKVKLLLTADILDCILRTREQD